ncbi:MAG: thiamine ABC transporter substrate-binding protein [Pseudobdellovibrionaceae bacterium]
MKHIIFYLTFVFMVLFFALVQKNNSTIPTKEQNKVLKVFGYSTFTGRWGPGPQLKELFEKECNCKVDYLEASDSGILLQRLKVEGESLGVDVVVGLDQFDLAKANQDQKWKKLNLQGFDFLPNIQVLLGRSEFVPFDWGVMAFITRKGAVQDAIKSLDDLLKPEFINQIALQDPRTSSPGLQLIYWLVQAKGEEKAFEFLENLVKQAHSFSPSWSTAYGLFSQKKVQTVFSYSTSPLFHKIEEKDDGVVALAFTEPHPVQVEFVGVPDFCSSCDLAEKFVQKMLSPEGQKIIMEKNYMFPVIQKVKNQSPFDSVTELQMIEINTPSPVEIDRWLQKWSVLRRQTKVK